MNQLDSRRRLLPSLVRPVLLAAGLALSACGGGGDAPADAPAPRDPLAAPSGGGGGAPGTSLAYSTYFGGRGDESLGGIAVDAAGNVYVTGTTSSVDFPTTTPGDQEVFVAKFDPAGRLVYSTLIGTPCGDSAAGIAVDAQGNAYVTGRAWEGFCWSDSMPVPDYPGVFVAKIDPTGAQSYFFFFGPASFDSSHGRAIAVNDAGEAYITGVTDPWSPGFPTTPGAWRTAPCSAGGDDGFVAKINAAGSALVYSTFLCGSGHDSPNAIAVDAAGHAYVAGSTHSADFPVVNGFQPNHRAAPYRPSGFVAKLAADGSALQYSSYLGGSDDSVVQGIALDALGHAFVTGYTTATDFPTTAGVVRSAPGSRVCLNGLCADAFVAKLAADGRSLVYSTYLAGDFDDAGVGIAVDRAGNAHVVGTTSSSTFPSVNALWQRKPGSVGTDAFVAQLNATATAFVRSSVLGGDAVSGQLLEGNDAGLAIALDGRGHAVVGGTTTSFNFPVTSSAHQRELASSGCGVLGVVCADLFITRFTAAD